VTDLSVKAESLIKEEENLGCLFVVFSVLGKK
jgi:hypothetical protein